MGVKKLFSYLDFLFLFLYFFIHYSIILSEPSLISLQFLSRLGQRYFDPSLVVTDVPKPSGSVRSHILTDGDAESHGI